MNLLSKITFVYCLFQMDINSFKEKFMSQYDKNKDGKIDMKEVSITMVTKLCNFSYNKRAEIKHVI